MNSDADDSVEDSHLESEEEESDEEEIDQELTIASGASDVLGTSFMGEPEITGRGADDSLAESSFASDETESEEEEEEEDSIVDRSARPGEVDEENDGYSDEDESVEQGDDSIVVRGAPPKEVNEEADGYSDEDESEEEEEAEEQSGSEGDDDEEEEEEDEEYEESSFDATASTISEPTPPRRKTVSPRKSVAKTPSKASPKKSLSKPLGESLRQAVVREEDESIEFIELVQGKTPAKKKRTLGKQKIVTEDDVGAPLAGAEVRRMVRM